MNYVSICSGIEAATVAWHPLGWRPLAFAEIEKFPSAVLAHYYAVPNVGDFTKIRGDEYGAVDVLVGGTPCQDFSVAGLRAGMDGKRGQLTVEYARLAGRMRPRWLVWENVPGVLSIDGGRAFGTFLGLLGQLGYGYAYRVLDAQHFGVPQRRRRVFVVGHLGDWRRAAAVLFERHSLSGYPAPRREAGKVAPTIPARSLGGGGLGTDFDLDGGFVASTGTGFPLRGLRRDECGDLVSDMRMVRPGAEAFGGNNCSGAIEIATAVNACASASGRLDFETETFIVDALNANGKSAGSATQQDAENGMLIAAHSLRGEGFDASEGTPLVPISIQNATRGKGSQHAVAMNLRGREGGAMPEMDHLASLRAASGGSSRSYIAGMAVRRLTPRECERLQGFPDDYTKISANTPDGSRYKAIGNSMARPVMEWIGERIAMVEAMEATR